MKALQIVGPGKIAIQEVPTPKPGPGEALVKIHAAALNRRDHWIREGKYPGIAFNTTLGSDGCGEVVALGGKRDTGRWMGKTVVINPNINWGNDPRCQSTQYQVLGMPSHGTLAEYIVAPLHRLVEKPRHLNHSEAAALPLAGLTAFRAVFYHGHLEKGQDVLITGIGGGVSQMAFLWAQAIKAKVSVTSGRTDKLQTMKKLGARKAYNYREEWARHALAEGVQFHLIIDSVGGSQLNELVKLTRPAGRIVYYGATTGLPPKLDLYRMFWNQLTLQGSTMGNDEEFQKMINFVSRHKLHPLVDSERPFDQVIEAFDRMKNVEQIGKIIVTLT